MFDLDPTFRIAFCAIVWMAIVVEALRSLSMRGYPTIGITFAFFGSYTSIHIGALVYLTEGYDPSLDPYLASFGHTPNTVALGFEASTLGMLCALIGTKLADNLWGARFAAPVQSQPPLSVFTNGAWLLIAVGLFGIVVDLFFPNIAASLSGLQAVISNSRNLLVSGGLLLCWREALAGRRRNATLVAVFFTLVVPAAVLVRTAILADSIFIGLAAFSFYISVRAHRGYQSRFLPNVALVAGLAIASFFFSVAWLDLRDGLRDALSRGGSITDAADTLSKQGRTDSPGSSSDAMQKALYAIDSRLNQNLFVGLAIQQLEALPDTYEEGNTIVLALFGWVPRIVWPGKPERGGAAMITKHTGKKTDGSTSFSTGLVFEFFVNFGYVGVVIGFLIIGFIVRVIDAKAYRALLAGQITPYAMYGLMGFALLQPGVDLVFIVAAMAAAAVFTAILSQPIAYFTAPRQGAASANALRVAESRAAVMRRRPGGVIEETKRN